MQADPVGASQPDKEWLGLVLPLYEATHLLSRKLSDAMREENLEVEMEAILEIDQKFPEIRDGIRNQPIPTSSEARQAKKSLEFALKDYVQGVEYGAQLFLEWADGASAKAAARRGAFLKDVFEEKVMKGERQMDQASKFFSSR